MNKKIQTAFSLIEIAENNLKNAKSILESLINESRTPVSLEPKQEVFHNSSEKEALEVVEGYFDGENMVGDNGQIYIVPQNYASKTKLVIGDRMKRILTQTREIYKLILPAKRKRITGTFSIEGDKYFVLSEQYPQPIRILKASATFAMKMQGLKIGDEVSVLIPEDSTPTWGALDGIVKSNNIKQTTSKTTDTSKLNDLALNPLEDLDALTGLGNDLNLEEPKIDEFF